MGKANALSFITDAEIESGIKHIVTPIIKAARLNPDEVKIYIVLSPEVNAFAINGQSVFINTGLIKLFNDVDILKGVFAHEIGHVTGGHIVRRHQMLEQLSSQAIITTLLGMGAALGGAPDAGMAILGSGSHSLERSMLRFSRENEYSADQAAFKYLRESHNSPDGLVKVLDYFNSQNISVDKDKFKYMLTHPLSNERLFAAKSQKKWPVNDKRNKTDQLVYNRIYAKLHGFTDKPQFVIERKNTDLDEFSRKYELSIAYYRKNNFKKSISLLNELITREPYNSYIYELKAQFLFEYGMLDEAIPIYEKALSLNQNDDLLRLELAIVLINSANKNSEESHVRQYYLRAIDLLKTVVIENPRNAWAYRNLSIAYGRIGYYGSSNVMLAEEALLYQKYDDAMRFAKNAQKYKLNNNLKLRVGDIIKIVQDIKNRG
ncbi:MAG: M48 family metalloprotease [Rickettsiales bacterium]